MSPEDILTHPANALSQAQREFYFENGFVAVDGLVPPEWVKRLTVRSDAFLQESQSITKSNEAFDLGPNMSDACAQPSIVIQSSGTSPVILCSQTWLRIWLGQM
jgi:hypothetical protein